MAINSKTINDIYKAILNKQFFTVNQTINNIIKLVSFKKINDFNTLANYSREYLDKIIINAYNDNQLDSFNLEENIDIKELNKLLWTNERIDDFLHRNINFIENANQLNQQLIVSGQFEQIINQFFKEDFPKFLVAFTMQKYDKVDQAVKALINDNSELLTAWKMCIKYFYHLNKLNVNSIATMSNPICLLGITDSELDKFSEQALNNNQLKQLLIKLIEEVSPVKVESYFNANQIIDDLSKLKLEVDKSLPVDGKLVHNISHSNRWIPLVYINGNVITDTATNGNRRTIHAKIFGDWFKNTDVNHDNDLVKYKKCPCNYPNIRKYHGVRGVMKDNVVILIDAEDLMSEAAEAINAKLGCKVLAFYNSFNNIVRKAYNTGFISSQDFLDEEDLNKYPTEQDWKDSMQIPFDKLIKPVEEKIKNFLRKEIRTIMSSSVRHYIHKNKEKSNEELYNFVISNISFSPLLYELQYDYEIDEYLQPIISRPQLCFDFINYIKLHFALYIKLLIDKYRKELILTSEQQHNNLNYYTDPYIRTPEQLALLIDDVGDNIQLDQSFNINYKCRDSAFIFVRGEAFTGDSHINLMTKYLKKHNIDDKYYFNLENIDALKLPYAYGHIYQGRALINWHKYCTVEDVKNALLKEGKYKVYDYNTSKQTLHRLAKKIK